MSVYKFVVVGFAHPLSPSHSVVAVFGQFLSRFLYLLLLSVHPSSEIRS